MDVVKTNIEKLKGTIEIQSTLNQGASFVISIPLTTSIMDGMHVKSSGQPYILPLDDIRELVDINSGSLAEIHDDEEFLNIRGKILPVVDLDKILGNIRNHDDFKSRTVVVVETSKGLVAVRVEAVLGQVQVVLKALGEFFPSSPGVAGAAILGDGKVALILDVDQFEPVKGNVA
jgi:two-component system chemotaxis sensor kinase CheA